MCYIVTRKEVMVYDKCMRIKTKKVFNLKEYLIEKAKRDSEYNEYVEEAIRRAGEDIAEGRVHTLEEFKKYMEEELGMKHVSTNSNKTISKSISKNSNSKVYYFI